MMVSVGSWVKLVKTPFSVNHSRMVGLIGVRGEIVDRMESVHGVLWLVQFEPDTCRWLREGDFEEIEMQKDVCGFCKHPLSAYEGGNNFCGECNRVLIACEVCPIHEPLFTDCIGCNVVEKLG